MGYALAEVGTNVEPEFQTQFVTAGSLLYSVEHRPWLPPDSQWLLSQSWNDVLFAHFAIDPPTLRRLVPDALTLDLYDGAAWLTISPFCTSHVRPSGIPPLPGISFFPQVSLRTYVTMQGKPGLFYFSVDAANLSAVWFARVFFRMQYWHAAIQISGATIQARNPAEANDSLPLLSSAWPRRINGPAKFDVIYSPEGEASGRAAAAWMSSSPNAIAYTRGIAGSITAPKYIISHGRCSGPASKSAPTA